MTQLIDNATQPTTSAEQTAEGAVFIQTSGDSRFAAVSIAAQFTGSAGWTTVYSTDRAECVRIELPNGCKYRAEMSGTSATGVSVTVMQ